MKILHRFHMASLRRNQGISLRDQVPINDTLKRGGYSSTDAYVASRTLRWAGHLVRLSDERLPRRWFYGELSVGAKLVGGQRKLFKDHLKRTLKSAI